MTTISKVTSESRTSRRSPARSEPGQRYISHWSAASRNLTNYDHIKFKMTSGRVSTTGQVTLESSNEVFGIDIGSKWRQHYEEGKVGSQYDFLGAGFWKVAIKVSLYTTFIFKNNKRF